MNAKIFIRRSQIQFELLPFPDDGNSYTRRAAHAWECTAIDFIERAGYGADVDADYGRDHTKFRVQVEPTETDEDGELIELTDEQSAEAEKIANDADSAGMEAAIKFAKEVAVDANPD